MSPVMLLLEVDCVTRLAASTLSPLHTAAPEGRLQERRSRVNYSVTVSGTANEYTIMTFKKRHASKVEHERVLRNETAVRHTSTCLSLSRSAGMCVAASTDAPALFVKMFSNWLLMAASQEWKDPQGLFLHHWSCGTSVNHSACIISTATLWATLSHPAAAETLSIFINQTSLS